MRQLGSLLAVVLMPFFVPTLAPASAEEPYRITRPADRILCLSPGLEAPEITSCVVETDAGLVLVDTGLSPAMAKRTLARIRREIGRDDVRWVVNTHSHFDHSNGNQLFAEALIIGHDNAPPEMRGYFDSREAWIERRLQRLDELDAEAAGLPLNSPRAIVARERRRFNEELIAALRGDFRPTPPNVDFSDRLSFTAGDLRLHLMWMGRCHTTSDILIRIPDLKVLFTGDLFHDEVLGPMIFTAPIDVDRWLQTLDAVLADDTLTTVIGGHGRIFTSQWLAAQRRYLGIVWDAALSTRSAGGSLAELEASLPFDDRFAFIAERIHAAPAELAERHADILRELWGASEQQVPPHAMGAKDS